MFSRMNQRRGNAPQGSEHGLAIGIHWLRRSLNVGFAVVALTQAATPIWASGGESQVDLRAATSGPGSHGRLDPDVLYFPPSSAGWAGEWRNSWDVAPYLALHEGGFRGEGGPREDPSPNQSLYDALSYDINLTLQSTTPRVTGTVTMIASVLTGPLSQMDVDLYSNMAISSLTSGGVAAGYVRTGNVVTVTLDRAYDTAEVVTLVFQYSGNPSGGYFAWDTNAGQPMIWTLSEPFGARSWWPCKDYSDDKADFVDIRVTTPTGLKIASNGTLMQETDNGTTSFAWWHESHPIATYLVSLAIHPYSVYSDFYEYSPGQQMEIQFYNFPADLAANQPVQAKVKDMIATFASKYGEYPFLDEKYGHAQFLWGGGMEHQTCTSLGFYGESVVAHELGHQWFGDDITCKTFHDVWLNEGFATYSEALWSELEYGPAAYFQDILANQYFGAGTIWVPELTDFGRIFSSSLSYNKASWVLHMLRRVVGDTAFFQILQEYRNQYSGRSAETSEFKDVCEQVSGLELDPFFNQWIYGEYYPIYQYSWTAAPGGGGYDVTLDLDQVQSWQIFNMPVDIRVKTVAGEENFVVANALAHESYVLHVNDEPTDVTIDKDNWILRVVLAPIPTPSFDRAILLVNGVDWNTYGSEITTAYTDKAFWGNYAIDFWDYFNEPVGGYPTTLPAPLGHGAVPGSELAHYRCVIWVGNNFGGDLSGWINTPIYDYLVKGGNVLLLSRMGEDFVLEPYREYLAVNWAGTGTVNDCIAAQPGLTNIARLGTQSFVATMNLTLGANSTLLYRAESGYNPDRALGVIQIPPSGGTYNPEGGRFCFLSGRPYRWNHTNLRTNVEFILANYLNKTATDVIPSEQGLSLQVVSSAPNPFREMTALRYSLAEAAPVRATIVDVSGRSIRTLYDGQAVAGSHVIAWDGRDDAGREAAAGVYCCRIESHGRTVETTVVRLR